MKRDRGCYVLYCALWGLLLDAYISEDIKR